MIDKEILKKYNEIKWKDLLLQTDHGSRGSLEEATTEFNNIKKFLDQIISYDNEGRIPKRYSGSIDESLNYLFDLLEAINDYQGESQKDRMIIKIRDAERYIWGTLKEVFAYANVLDSEKQDVNNLSAKQIGKLTDKIEKLTNEGKVLRDSLDKVKTSVQTEEGNNYSDAFEAQSVVNEKKARSNFLLMIGSLLIVVGFGAYSMGYPMKSILADGIPRLTILSAFIYLVAFFGRKSLAENHLYHVNKHRQNAINSHRDILKSIHKEEGEAIDWQTHNAILVQVTKAMYDHVDTGYLKRGSGEKSNNLMENIVIKAVDK